MCVNGSIPNTPIRTQSHVDRKLFLDVSDVLMYTSDTSRLTKQTHILLHNDVYFILLFNIFYVRMPSLLKPLLVMAESWSH